VKTQIVPRAASLLRSVEVATVDVAAHSEKVQQSLTQLTAASTETVEQLRGQVELTTAHLNSHIAAVGELSAQNLQHLDERLQSDEIDRALTALKSSAENVQDGTEHLTETLKLVQASAGDLKNTTAHAPAIAESVDKIFRDQRKWSTWLLIARLVSLIR
jgi:hypothetical protein